MTFDLFSVDPELLTPLTLASDSGGHTDPVHFLVWEDKEGEIHLQIDACEDSAFPVRGWHVRWSIIL